MALVFGLAAGVVGQTDPLATGQLQIQGNRLTIFDDGVANDAEVDAQATLENVTGAIRLPSGNVLRLAATDPQVGIGQKVPLAQANGSRILAPGEQGSAAWTVEGLVAGTHVLQMDIGGELVRRGPRPLPIAVPRTSGGRGGRRTLQSDVQPPRRGA